MTSSHISIFFFIIDSYTSVTPLSSQQGINYVSSSLILLISLYSKAILFERNKEWLWGASVVVTNSQRPGGSSLFLSLIYARGEDFSEFVTTIFQPGQTLKAHISKHDFAS